MQIKEGFPHIQDTSTSSVKGTDSSASDISGTAPQSAIPSLEETQETSVQQHQQEEMEGEEEEEREEVGGGEEAAPGDTEPGTEPGSEPGEEGETPPQEQ